MKQYRNVAIICLAIAAVCLMLLMAPASCSAVTMAGKVYRMRCVTARARILKYYEVHWWHQRGTGDTVIARGWEVSSGRRWPWAWLEIAPRPRQCVGESWVVGERY